MKRDLKFAKSLYNLKSFEDRASDAKQFKDEGGLILARNLEFVSPEIFTQEYAGLTFLNQGIIVNNEGGYATSVEKLKLSVTGDYRESGDNTNTTGKIGLTAEDDSIPVYTLEAESDWSEIELKRAELQNLNLPSRYMEAHAERYNRKIDQIGYLGQTRTDGSQKTTGLLNSAFDSTAASNTAANLTGTELYGEIATLITSQWAGVLNVETYKADRVVMPDDVYNIASTKILNSAGSEMSVLAALRANFPTVEFGLTTKAGDVGGNSVTCAFSTNRRALQMRIPVPMQVSSVYQKGHKYYVESYFGVAGLDIIESNVARYLTGL